ncbi:MAG: tRNA 4-thiouridine(8) synthase ThiI [Clostridia bacterium]|nr:tRNA 4-thiouridine(8) synthase ThiI [Clostridia bacterium]
MQEVILVKLGEIVLKGLNRRVFEDRLLKNIRRRIARAGNFEVTSSQSTVYIVPKDEDADIDEAEERVSKVFGIIGYTRACVCEKDMDTILKTAPEYLGDILADVSTFKVESKRADKKFPLDSMQISREVGGALLRANKHLSVDVHNPQMVVRVEIREKAAYIHGETKPGAGGIPVGTGGKAAILISGGLDSPVAAWMMAKRGVELTAIHFASPPYTSERAHEKVVSLLKKVGEYAGRMEMITVPFTKIQEEIRDHCPEELATVIMRRFMMRAAERIAREKECSALITGESLGQVASQTIQAIACTDAAANMPIFRPLIGSDKSEIVAIAHRIDTYDISIEPYEDCCTVFTPRHPRTRPTLNIVEAAEKNLDVEALVEDCLKNVEVRYL